MPCIAPSYVAKDACFALIGCGLLLALQVYQQVGSEPQQRLAEALAAAEAATAQAEAARAEAAAAAAAAGGVQDTAAAGGGGDRGPVRQLATAAAAEAAAAAAAAAHDEAEAIKAALTGMVWTRSMKRLYTLVDRCAAIHFTGHFFVPVCVRCGSKDG